MAWVIFTDRFNFVPPEDRRLAILYKPSAKPRCVRRVCALQAIAAGKARQASNPRFENEHKTRR